MPTVYAQISGATVLPPLSINQLEVRIPPRSHLNGPLLLEPLEPTAKGRIQIAPTLVEQSDKMSWNSIWIPAVNWSHRQIAVNPRLKLGKLLPAEVEPPPFHL